MGGVQVQNGGELGERRIVERGPHGRVIFERCQQLADSPALDDRQGVQLDASGYQLFEKLDGRGPGDQFILTGSYFLCLA